MMRTGNWELDMNEQGIPVEGYARETRRGDVRRPLK